MLEVLYKCGNICLCNICNRPNGLILGTMIWTCDKIYRMTQLNYSPLLKSDDEVSLLRNWLFFSSPKSSTKISWLRVMSSSDSFAVWFEAMDLFLRPQDSTDSCPHSHTACNSMYWVYSGLDSRGKEQKKKKKAIDIIIIKTEEKQEGSF